MRFHGWYLFVCLFACEIAADELIPESPQPRWWRGNIHTHSLWSDGDDFPEMIAEWYRTHDYNFLALSDHNVLSRGQRWMSAARIEERGGKSVLPKYRARFGGGWVETRNKPAASTEEKGPEAGELEVRLKPLDEYRALVEERGKFIMIEGEEISDRVSDFPVHMNATNLAKPIQPVGGTTIQEAMNNNLRMVAEQADAIGREILVHLNHPNYGYAVTAEDLAAVVRERFFEVFNGHPAVGHLGDEDHPGVERMWDIANTLRLGKLDAPPLFGVATDDSHRYHDKISDDGAPPATSGKGWIMVRSAYLTPEHLIRAMRAGDFYASSGVRLRLVDFDSKARTLSVAVEPVGDET